MPYTRITPSRNGREAIAYALGDEKNKGHNGNEVRNLLVTSVGLSQEPPAYADQMDEYWRQASSRNKTQVRRIITSYSKEELDPNDPKSALIAAEIAREHAKTAYPDRQVLICVQMDGVGGLIHTHTLVNNVSITDHKGCTDEQTKFHYVAKTIDSIAKQYIDLSMDYSDKWDEKTGRAILPKDKVNQNVRRMRDANREAVASGEEKTFYIWQDDLKNRVLLAMDEATTREDFEQCLTKHGVEIGRSGYSKKHGEYFTFELIDTTGFAEPPSKDMKVRSYNLGDDFTPEALERRLKSKQKQEPVKQTIGIQTIPRNVPTIPAVQQKQVKRYEMSDEEKSKTEQEANAFSSWCREQGISYFTLEKGMDLDAYEDAKRQYAEWKKEQELKTTSYKAQEGMGTNEDDKNIVEGTNEPEKTVQSVPRLKKRDGKISRTENVPKQTNEPVKMSVKQNKNADMMRRIIRDIQEANQDYFGNNQSDDDFQF